MLWAGFSSLLFQMETLISWDFSWLHEVTCTPTPSSLATNRECCVLNLPDFLFCYKAKETVFCLLFCYCNKLSWPKQLKKGKVYLGLPLQEDEFIPITDSKHGSMGGLEAGAATESSHLKLQAGSRHNRFKCLRVFQLSNLLQGTQVSQEGHISQASPNTTQLGTKSSKARAYGGHSHSNHSTVLFKGLVYRGGGYGWWINPWLPVLLYNNKIVNRVFIIRLCLSK